MVKKGRTGTADPRQAARERLSKETGYTLKDPGGRLTVALVYPNSYEIGMSNLGFHKIYRLFNSRDDVAIERAFLPSGEEAEFLRKNRRYLTSMETGRPLSKFDVIAFSITFEADYINVLEILDLAGLPLRRDGNLKPLVMAGGIAVTLNPEPLAPFIDVFAIGEGEGIVNPFTDSVQSGGLSDLSTFAGIAGLYVPSAYEPEYSDDGRILRCKVKDGFPEKVKRVWDVEYGRDPNRTVIETPDTVFGDMALVEIGKGCGRHCRFCAAGYAYRPTRHAETGAVLEAVDDALDKKGKVGLVSSAIGDHPDVELIFRHIAERGGEFSVSSLRLDRLTDTMLENLKKGNCHTITLAPEAGTERLRKIVNKNISDDTILDTARRIAVMGEFKLKLYFLVGLPWETDEDVDGITTLVGAIKDEMSQEWKKRGKMSSITVGVDGFVPKANTPFQWKAFEGVKNVDRKIKKVVRALREVPNVTVHAGSARRSYIQAVLSMGDRRVGDILELAWRCEGDWSRAFRESAVDADFYAVRERNADEVLPWSVIDHGLRESYLGRDLERSAKGKTVAECPAPGTECHRCGEFYGVCAPEKDCKTPE